jgi:predicted nucleic acid-binding protein
MSAEVAYLDASAVVKLVVREAETPALRRRVGAWPRASSSLLRVELLQAVGRVGIHVYLEGARRQLANIDLIRVDDDLLARAAEIELATVLSHDAIHLAAAQALGLPLIAPA